MKSKIEETYCVETDKGWCAVLGNHYPNFSQKVAEDIDGVVDGGLKGFYDAGARMWSTQRLCDQRNVQYKLVVLQAPTCIDCLRIKGLMVEFARIPDPEDIEEPSVAEEEAVSGINAIRDPETATDV